MANRLVQPCPYTHLQISIKNAASSFVQAGMRVDRSDQARFVAEAEHWERGVEAEIDEDWWHEWTIPEQRAFLDDMRDLKALYDQRPARLGAPEHMPDLAEPRLVCWTTLQTMRKLCSRIQIVEQAVHQIASSPPPGTDSHRWAQNVGDWFQLGFVELIKPADFHRADLRLRHRVVDEFEHLDKTLVEHYKAGRLMRLPALSDMRYFRSLVDLLEQNRVKLGIRNSVHLDLKQQATIIANKLLGLPWWRTQPDGAKLQKRILNTLVRLTKMPYQVNDLAKFDDVMALLDKLRDEEDEPSLSSSGRRCSVQSLGHRRFGYRG
ncbi:hypothetical protein JCM8208_007411 [Rhodotorula glutinis]